MSEFYLRDVEDTEFIVGRPFSDEDGEHEPGESYSQEQANKLHYLEAFVNSGFLYRVHDQNYDQLPPHVFNHVKTRQEAQALIEGDPSTTNPEPEWEKPAAAYQAEREAEVQTEIHANVLAHAEAAHEQHGYTAAEQVLQKEQEEIEEAKATDGPPARKKAAAKKTATKKA